jgi:lactoylglutathione lyase
MIHFLHTRIRVSDLEKTIAFYEKLGFRVTRRTDKSPAGNQLAFLEIEGNKHFLELCYSPDFEVKFPEDLMHTAIGVPNILTFCDELEKGGIAIWPGDWREAFPTGKKPKMAFVTDPDGYEVEILERAPEGEKAEERVLPK